MNNIILFLISVVLTETVTDIVVKSVLFEPVRAWFFKRKANKVFNFIHDLLDCPICFSVWSGTLVGLVVLNIHIVSFWVDWFIIGLLLHKSSNVLHNFIDRTRRSEN